MGLTLYTSKYYSYVNRMRDSLVVQRVKRLPVMREDPLEKEMATHCSTLA